MRTYNYFTIGLQTSKENLYRNEQITDHQSNDQLGALVTLLLTRGTISHKGLVMRNWPLTGSMEVKLTRCYGATVRIMYTFIYPIQNILRI